MTSTDLAVRSLPDELERAADPAEFVTRTLELAKTWLANALEHGDIEQIVELKSQAEAIRVYTMSKQLGQDAQLSAAEIVRRAERGIGLAIRKGQEDGSVAKRGDVGSAGSAGATGGTPGALRGGHLARPAQFVDKRELSNGIYPLTDDVSTAAFEQAIVEARAEGNLSRANVVRKVRQEEKPVAVPSRTSITNLPAQRRAFTAACTTLSGISYGLTQIEEIHPDITSEEAAEWVGGLSEARRELERVIKLLKKERTNRA